jgi:hypothetical protein
MVLTMQVVEAVRGKELVQDLLQAEQVVVVRVVLLLVIFLLLLLLEVQT